MFLACRPQVVGDFNDPLKGMINLDVTLYNGNASAVGFKTDANGDAMYLYEIENGFDYVQVCFRMFPVTRQ
jgi:hypothetical protein